MRRFSANSLYATACPTSRTSESWDKADHPLSSPTAKKRTRQKRLLLQILVGTLISTWLIYQSHSIPLLKRILTGDVIIRGHHGRSDASAPKISLIVVWTGDERFNYLSWFFDSIARQPEELELVVIQRGSSHLDLTPAITEGTTNIKIVQMTNERCTCAELLVLPPR